MITKWTVEITGLGECLQHVSLGAILDSVVNDYHIPVDKLLDSVAIKEVCKDGYTGGTISIGEQYQVIKHYVDNH